MSLYQLYPSVADHLAESTGYAWYVGDPPSNVPTPYGFTKGPIPVEDPSPMALVAVRGEAHVVGKAEPEANRQADTVALALEDFIPTVPGYDCQPLRVKHTTTAITDSQVTEPDSNLRPAKVVVVFHFEANRKREP